MTVKQDHKPLEVIAKKFLNPQTSTVHATTSSVVRYQPGYRKGKLMQLSDMFSKAYISEAISRAIEAELFSMTVEQ